MARDRADPSAVATVLANWTTVLQAIAMASSMCSALPTQNLVMQKGHVVRGCSETQGIGQGFRLVLLLMSRIAISKDWMGPPPASSILVHHWQQRAIR